MILFKTELVNAIHDREIIFEQPNADGLLLTDWSKVGPNSLDVTLSKWIRRQRSNHTSSMYRPTLEPLDYDVDDYWGPAEFLTHIVLQPGETILAVTNETVGSKTRYVPILKQRSGLGRIGQNFMAGFGDVGYIARWTLELTNMLRRPVLLEAGMRVAQIYFTQGIGNAHYQGSYGQGSWTPADMLPKLYRNEKRNSLGWPLVSLDQENRTKIVQNRTHAETIPNATEREDANSDADAIQQRIDALHTPYDGLDSMDEKQLASGELDYYGAVKLVREHAPQLSDARISAELSVAIFEQRIGHTKRPAECTSIDEYFFWVYRNLRWRGTVDAVEQFVFDTFPRTAAQPQRIVFEDLEQWEVAVNAAVAQRTQQRTTPLMLLSVVVDIVNHYYPELQSDPTLDICTAASDLLTRPITRNDVQSGATVSANLVKHLLLHAGYPRAADGFAWKHTAGNNVVVLYYRPEAHA